MSKKYVKLHMGKVTLLNLTQLFDQKYHNWLILINLTFSSIEYARVLRLLKLVDFIGKWGPSVLLYLFI